jgi:hypothetical protein
MLKIQVSSAQLTHTLVTKGQKMLFLTKNTLNFAEMPLLTTKIQKT